MSPHFNISKEGLAERLESVADLVGIAGRLKASTVLIPGGDRVEDLRLVESARDHGIVDRIILVGRKKALRGSIEEVGIKISPRDIIAADDHEAIAAATVKKIRAGGVDIVLKGNISTPILNRAMRPLAVRSTVSLATIFDSSPISEGRPIILTDAGFTTVCNFGRMVDLIRNAVDVARIVMGIDRPRVAILSANEKEIPSLPSTWMGAKLTERRWKNALVYGPLSFDLATDPESVAIKGVPPHPRAAAVAGRADILVCPGIDTANALYKTLAALNKFGLASLAGITVGFPFPYVILSRSDSLETRLESVALGSIFAQRVRSWQEISPILLADAAPPKTYRVLVVNPGSTSSKVALFENGRCLKELEATHHVSSARTPADRREQAGYLAAFVRRELKEWGSPRLDAVVGRGGFLPRPEGKLSAGTYLIAEKKQGRIILNKDIVSGVLDHPGMVHASNLGIPVAAALARQFKVPAYCVDPVVVDEFSPEAELSGYAPITRRSTAHVLNIRAAARRAAQEIGQPLNEINLVVAHLGGGITIAALRRGKLADDTIALLGGGPFTPQRAGQLTTESLIELCYSGRFTREELIEELTKRGGLRSYLGEDRMEVIEERIAGGDRRARLVASAMIYQIAKEIGAMCVAAGGDVEAIVLTGGLARNRLVLSELRRRVKNLAPVLAFPGSLELEAMAEETIAVLSGRREARRYRLPKRLRKKEKRR